MKEVRFHGRGGMGVKSAAHLFAVTCFLSGFQTQDFSLYGAERRGAPVTSFTRYEKKPILERGYIFEPDIVVILDETLSFKIMLKGLKKKGIVIINTKKKPSYFKKKYKVKNVYCIDATEMALEILGVPIPNTAMLSALVKLLKLPVKNLKDSIKEKLGKKGKSVIEKNFKVVEEVEKLIK